MIVKWITLRAARRFVAEHHRHGKRVAGGIVALGAWIGQPPVLIGVVILGRPVARMDGMDAVEITRLCTNGHPNGCSKLYAKAKRLAQALGLVPIKTFTRQWESGASLRAVGAKLDGMTEGGDWSREGRERETACSDPKRRWLL